MSAPNSADELAAPLDVLLIDGALGPMRSGLGGPASSFLRSLSDFSDDEVRSLHNLLERLAQSVEGHAPVI